MSNLSFSIQQSSILPFRPESNIAVVVAASSERCEIAHQLLSIHLGSELRIVVKRHPNR
jgi:hypothetical protein